MTKILQVKFYSWTTSSGRSLYAHSQKNIEDNEMMETARKGCMLEAVSTLKWEPWSDKKISEKDVLV